MYGLYNSFNFLTGYKEINPSVQSIEWRLIVLESVAGVPGFVAAGKDLYSIWNTYKIQKTSSANFSDVYSFLNTPSEIQLLKYRGTFLFFFCWHAPSPYLNYTGFRHFRSLRTLERDRGWIATLLEEAENERMHLLLCLNKFKAGKTWHPSNRFTKLISCLHCAITY